MKTLPQRQAQPPIGNYLEGEQSSDIRHEYLAGQVVAMEGATRTHALIAGSLHAALLPAARRKGCQLFMADMKVRIDHADESYFYYPDVVLSCATADRHPLYTALPCLIVEVLSESTARIDRREKLLAYQGLSSLQTYLLVEQDVMRVELYRRTNDWRVEYVEQGDIPVDCLDMALPLTEIYADVPWPAPAHPNQGLTG